MKATGNNDCHSPQNQQKKGVTFDAMEMLERNSDCIGHLTSLVSDLKMMMDRKQPQYKPKIYQDRPQNQNVGRQNFTSRNRSFSQGRKQGGNRGNFNNRNNYRPNYRNRSRGRCNNHRSGDRSGNYPNYNRRGNTRLYHRQTHNGHLETEVKVEVEMKTMVIINLEVEVEIEIKGDEKNPGLDLIQG